MTDVYTQYIACSTPITHDVFAQLATELSKKGWQIFKASPVPVKTSNLANSPTALGYMIIVSKEKSFKDFPSTLNINMTEKGVNIDEIVQYPSE